MQAKEHIDYLHSQGLAAIIQPYISSIDTCGERALMYFNGDYDHAIVKQPILKPGERFDAVHALHPGPRAYQPTAAEQKLAKSALDILTEPGELLSGRVDVVIGPDGSPMLAA